MNRLNRLAALEAANSKGVQLHFPQDGDDHSAAWAQLQAKRGTVHVVCFPGLNAEAVAAFKAAEPGL